MSRSRNVQLQEEASTRPHPEPIHPESRASVPHICNVTQNPDHSTNHGSYQRSHQQPPINGHAGPSAPANFEHSQHTAGGLALADTGESGMTDDHSHITPETAERMLAGAPSIRLEVSVAEADLLVLHLSTASGMSTALLAKKIRLQALPQAQEICTAVAVLLAGRERRDELMALAVLQRADRC